MDRETKAHAPARQDDALTAKVRAARAERAVAKQAGAVICGARSKSTGKPCQSTAVMTNGRCRAHGGAATGPIDRKKASESAKGNSNAETHGLYSDVLKGRAKEVYEKALGMPGKELVKNNATLLAGTLAEAMDEPEDMPGARGAVIAYIDWKIAQSQAFPGVEVPMPPEVENARFGFEVGAMLKRRIYQPALAEQAKVVQAITKAAEVADKKDDGVPPGSEVQGAGVLVLPEKEDDDQDEV